MQASDREHFVSALEALAATFRVDPTEALLEGYWMALDDMPIEGVMRAVRSAMRQCKHMPRGVELRELAGEINNATRAVHAWSAVQKAIGQHGAYRSVDFDDQVINATVRNLGGWIRLCELSSEEAEKWTRKDFDRIYTALCASGVTEDQAKHLVGAHEQTNAGTGFESRAPTLVRTGLPPHREGIVRELGPRSDKAMPAHVVNLLAAATRTA